MVLAVAGLVLVHGHVEHPVEAVLDPPMCADDLTEPSRRQWRAEQIVGGFLTGQAIDLTASRDFAAPGQA